MELKILLSKAKQIQAHVQAEADKLDEQALKLLTKYLKEYADAGMTPLTDEQLGVKAMEFRQVVRGIVPDKEKEEQKVEQKEEQKEEKEEKEKKESTKHPPKDEGGKKKRRKKTEKEVRLKEPGGYTKPEKRIKPDCKEREPVLRCAEFLRDVRPYFGKAKWAKRTKLGYMVRLGSACDVLRYDTYRTYWDFKILALFGQNLIKALYTKSVPKWSWDYLKFPDGRYQHDDDGKRIRTVPHTKIKRDCKAVYVLLNPDIKDMRFNEIQAEVNKACLELTANKPDWVAYATKHGLNHVKKWSPKTFEAVDQVFNETAAPKLNTHRKNITVMPKPTDVGFSGQQAAS